MSKNFDSSFKASVFGIVSPVSQRDTACRVTWIFSASSSWDNPLFVRSSCIIFFVSISFTTFKYSISYFVDSEKQPAVAVKLLYSLQITTGFALENISVDTKRDFPWNK